MSNLPDNCSPWEVDRAAGAVYRDCVVCGDSFPSDDVSWHYYLDGFVCFTCREDYPDPEDLS